MLADIKNQFILQVFLKAIIVINYSVIELNIGWKNYK